MRPPRLLILIGLATLVTARFGAAASLGGINTTSLGAGSSAVLTCDGDGMSVTHTTSGGQVTAVTVGGIADPACEGARLSLTLTDSTNGAIGSGGGVTIPSDADTTNNSVSVSLSPQPDAELVGGVHISVVGP